MNLADEMRQLTLKDYRCSDELVDKFYEQCIKNIKSSASRGYSNCHFWNYSYKDSIGNSLNDEGCTKLLKKLQSDGFKVSNSTDIYGKKIVDMYDIEW